MVTFGRYAFRKCACEKIFRGDEFKKHVRNFPTEEKVNHRKIIQVICCSKCRECSDTQNTECLNKFYLKHDACSTVAITNPSFKQWLDETFNSALQVKEVEEAAHFIQRFLNSERNQEESRNEEEDRMQEVRRQEEDKRQEGGRNQMADGGEDRRVGGTGLSDLSTTSSDSEEEYLTGIRKQTNRWARDTEKARLSQEANYGLLKDKLAERTKVNESLIRENEDLKSKVTLVRQLKDENLSLRAELKAWQEKEVRWRKECRDKEDKVKEIESKWREEQVQRREREKEWQTIESEHKRLKAEVLDLIRGRERQRDLEETVNRQNESIQQLSTCRHVEIHLPLYQNRVIDTPLIVGRWEQVVECYEDKERGIRCEHLQIEVRGELLRLQYRKAVRKRVPSKFSIVIDWKQQFYGAYPYSHVSTGGRGEERKKRLIGKLHDNH